MPDETRRPSRKAGCPVCGKPSQPETRPFCSARCKQIDLGRWLNGDYAIPGPPAEAEEEAER